MSVRACLVVLLGVLLAACASGPPAPIEQKGTAGTAPRPLPPPASRPAPRPAVADAVATEHVVVRGDTVHGIAWRYKLDHRDLVRWNALSNPDLIFIGQRLRLTPPSAPAARVPAVTAAPAPRPASPPRPAPAPTVAAVAPVRATPAAPARAAPEPTRGPLRWQWPAQGRTTRATSVSGSSGLDIRGDRGQPVKAAAAGTVVYSGSGLRGYGELIIVQHNDTFLSAYAHNEARLVQEGSRVDGGQTIARMGNTDAKDVMLHFEIRRNGKAVDPLQFLPRR